MLSIQRDSHLLAALPLYSVTTTYTAPSLSALKEQILICVVGLQILHFPDCESHSRTIKNKKFAV